MTDETSRSREALRSRRKRVVRSKTVNVIRLPKRDLALGTLMYPEPIENRPRTRGDCADGVRPCPYAACRYHLFIDVLPTGSIKFNFPDLEVEDLTETCSLDVADQGGESLEIVGELMNLTRERLRQLEVVALKKLEGDQSLILVADTEERTPCRSHHDDETETTDAGTDTDEESDES